MSTNAQLIRVFNEMAAVLELTGGNSFRASSHARVARAIRDLSFDIAEIAGEKRKLLEIEGIGEGSAKRIQEFVKTGRVKEHDDLVEQIPPGLLAVLKVPGLGPKTIAALWKNAGVADLDSLKAAVESGALEGLPRMGPKSIENIRKSLAFLDRAVERTRLGDALPFAEVMVARLQSETGVQRVQYAGSLRRGCETIGDIDILATASRPAELAKTFRTLPAVEQVLAAGETKSSVRIAGGMQVDLRVVDEGCFGAALLYFTGSKQHNVRLRERAIKRGLRLNEYGLFADDGVEEPPQKRRVKPVAAKTERDIYAALDLPFIPPELREDRGEFDCQLPKLLELKQIKADLHAHTIASDGKFTIDELAMLAKARGYHTVAITDHSKASAQAGGLSEDALRKHIDAVRKVNERVDGITILAGTECDILADGHLDYSDEVLALTDIVIASPHVALKQDAAKATQRLIAAVSHPLVHVLGHPTGRIINRREGLSADMSKVIEAAAEHGTALEVNANYFRLDLRDTHVRAAVDAGCVIAINTDAHSAPELDNMMYGVITARRGWLTVDQCVNAWSARKLHGWLKRKR